MLLGFDRFEVVLGDAGARHIVQTTLASAVELTFAVEYACIQQMLKRQEGALGTEVKNVVDVRIRLRVGMKLFVFEVSSGGLHFQSDKNSLDSL